VSSDAGSLDLGRVPCLVGDRREAAADLSTERTQIEVEQVSGRRRYELRAWTRRRVWEQVRQTPPAECGDGHDHGPAARIRALEARFESRLLPLFKRRTEEVGRLLPQLYLHGLAHGDFDLALRGLGIGSRRRAGPRGSETSRPGGCGRHSCSLPTGTWGSGAWWAPCSRRRARRSAGNTAS
jgi:hypothetical protein